MSETQTKCEKVSKCMSQVKSECKGFYDMLRTLTDYILACIFCCALSHLLMSAHIVGGGAAAMDAAVATDDDDDAHIHVVSMCSAFNISIEGVNIALQTQIKGGTKSIADKSLILLTRTTPTLNLCSNRFFFFPQYLTTDIDNLNHYHTQKCK